MFDRYLALARRIRKLSSWTLLLLVCTESPSITWATPSKADVEERVQSANTLEALDEIYTEVLSNYSGNSRKEIVSIIRKKSVEILDTIIVSKLSTISDLNKIFEIKQDINTMAFRQYRHLFISYSMNKTIQIIFQNRANDFVCANSNLICMSPDWYPCRGENCRYGKNLSNFESGYVQCPICNFDGCLRCGDISKHDDCVEFKNSLKELESAGIVCHPCPNCKVMVSKDGGCDRMTCPDCGKQWEWSTGKTGRDLSVEHVWINE